MLRMKQESAKRLFGVVVVTHCFFVLYCIFFWGKDFVQVTGTKIGEKIYDTAVELIFAEIIGCTEEGSPWAEVCVNTCPSVGIIQLAPKGEVDLVWEEDEQTVFEEMVEENQSYEHMILENEKQKNIEDEKQKNVKSEEGKSKNIGSQNGKKQKEAEKVVSINRKKLEDFDYLCQNFYQIDNTTTIKKEQLDVKKLLGKDMSVDLSVKGPQILIYHTHSQEGYQDGREGQESKSVLAIGDCLEKYLEDAGFTVLHHKGKYDVGDRDHAYSKAAPALEQLLKEHPSIQVVIDLHRDGVAETTHLVTEINGEKTAQIMFFNGLSRTTSQGDIASLRNPYIEDNLALSFQLELVAKEYYPNFTRRTYLKGYRYNMHMLPKSVLVEVGAQTNTYEEAENAMKPLADILCKVLKKS